MGHRAETQVDGDQHWCHRVIGRHHDHRHRGQDESGGVHQGMGTERREDGQLLLGVVDGMHSPQGPKSVFAPVRKPVTRVHGDQGDDDQDPSWPRGGLIDNDPARMVDEKGRDPDAYQGDQGNYEQAIEDEKARVLDVSSCQGAPPFSWPKLLANEYHENQPDERRAHELISARGERLAQFAVVIKRLQPDPNEPPRHHRVQDRRQVELSQRPHRFLP